MAEEVSARITIEGNDALRTINNLSKSFVDFQKTATTSLNKTTTSLEIFKGSLLAAFAVDAIKSFGNAASFIFNQIKTEGVQAAIEAESSMKRLAFAFQQTGVDGQKTAASFQVFAKEVQSLTGVQDDLIISNAAVLQATTKMTEEGLKRATVAAIELSAATGKDLDTSFRAIQQAANGNTGALQRMGIEIQKGATDAETFSNALVKIGGFQGAAEAQTKSFSGAVQALSNSYGDVFKSVGEIIIQNPAVVSTLNLLRTVFQNLGAVIENNRQVISNYITSGIAYLLNAYNSVVQSIQNVKIFFDNLVSAFNQNKSSIETLTQVIAIFVAGIAIYNSTVILAAARTAAMTIALNGYLIAQIAVNGAVAIAQGLLAGMAAVMAFLTSPIGLVTAAIAGLVIAYNALNLNTDIVIGGVKNFLATLIDVAMFLTGPYFEAISVIAGLFNKEWAEAIDGAKLKVNEFAEGLRKSSETQLEAGFAFREAEILKQEEIEKTRGVATESNQQLLVDIEAVKKGTAGLIETNKVLGDSYVKGAEIFAETKQQELSILDAFALAKKEKEKTAREDEVILKQLQNNEDFQFLVDKLGQEEALKVAHETRELQRQGKNADAAKKIREAQVKAEKNDIFAIQSFETLSQKQRLDNLKSTLGTISSLTSSNNKTLFRIGQAAAISTAIVDGVAAVQKALASAPPPFNFILAGIVGAATAANVTKIASTPPPQMAQGGIVPGNSFTGDRVIARVNSGEMVLNRSQQTDLFNSLRSGEFGSSSPSNISEAMNNLADAIRSQPISVNIREREIARAVRDASRAGFVLA